MKDPIFHGIWMLFAATFCMGLTIGSMLTQWGYEKQIDEQAQKIAEYEGDYLRFTGPYSCVCNRCPGEGFPETAWYAGCKGEPASILSGWTTYGGISE